MLEGLKSQVQGRVAMWLQASVASRAEQLLDQAIAEAVLVWEGDGFSRWSDEEISFTARLYDCCDRAIRSHQTSWPLVHVQYDGPQLTRAMRAGQEDPSHAPRPDLSVRVGGAEVKLEAKRLMLRNGLPAKYVREGMRRFVDGRYASTPPLPGAMIGYVLADPVQDIVSAVNVVVTAEADFGPSHVLGLGAVSQRVSVHRSQHRPRPDLVHFMIEIA